MLRVERNFMYHGHSRSYWQQVGDWHSTLQQVSRDWHRTLQSHTENGYIEQTTHTQPVKWVLIRNSLQAPSHTRSPDVSHQLKWLWQGLDTQHFWEQNFCEEHDQKQLLVKAQEANPMARWAVLSTPTTSTTSTTSSHKDTTTNRPVSSLPAAPSSSGTGRINNWLACACADARAMKVEEDRQAREKTPTGVHARTHTHTHCLQW